MKRYVVVISGIVKYVFDRKKHSTVRIEDDIIDSVKADSLVRLSKIVQSFDNSYETDIKPY